MISTAVKAPPMKITGVEALPIDRYLFAQVHTDEGIVGLGESGTWGYLEASQAAIEKYGRYLVGEDPARIEHHWNVMYRSSHFRGAAIMGALSAIDIALWDIAGKLYEAPIAELLGGFRPTLPAYASTYHGDEHGGLSSPEAFAEFALQCRELGYPAFKIHGWGNGPIRREVATVLATRKAVGDGIDLMLDPACEYDTWADTLKVGLACDEARFLWLEDPFKDGGSSAFGHRKLHRIIKTPILLGEHIRGHELHVDNIVTDGTDFVRADADYDCGITGLMKIAHSAEGFGLDVEIHAPGPMHRHCMAAIRNTNYYELGLVHPELGRHKPPVYAADYSDDLDAVDANGHVPVPRGPSLGVPVDWDWVRAHEAGTVVYE
jgi:L-alanine-DL-glutamate epimerase-like enolase superfamily enzyme